MTKLTEETNCPNCGAGVKLAQDINLGEYVPFGKCGKCKKLIIMVREDVIALGAEKLYVGGTWRRLKNRIRNIL